MIPATQRKLREAQFFLRHLCDENKQVSRKEPDAFQFYLSAFLSAGRSVTFALKWEEKEKYKDWSEGWFSRLDEQDQQLCRFMIDQRNIAQKRGGAETQTGGDFVPVTELLTDDRSHPSYGFHWVAPVGTPPPQIFRSVELFEMEGTEAEVTATCTRYLQLLDELVQDFIAAYDLLL